MNVEACQLVCGARGRRQGLAGLRADAPSEARSADGERAGRRPPAHTAAGPTRRPEHQRGHKHHHQLGGPPPTGTPSSPAHQHPQRNEAVTGFPATASAR